MCVCWLLLFFLSSSVWLARFPCNFISVCALFFFLSSFATHSSNSTYKFQPHENDTSDYIFRFIVIVCLMRYVQCMFISVLLLFFPRILYFTPKRQILLANVCDFYVILKPINCSSSCISQSLHFNRRIFVF